jgi:hypothetical protein
MRKVSSDDMPHHRSKRSAAGALTALYLTACGGGNSPPGPQGPFDLHAAVAALVKSGSSTKVNLSGTVIVNGTATPFTGTGNWILTPGVGGTFNGSPALLQTENIAGTVTVAGQSSPYTSSVVNAYDSTTSAILGESQSSEFDVAPAPITIPAMVGTSVTNLGAMSRYADQTLSVGVGTTQVSVTELYIPVDPGSPEVVQFTYKVYDMHQMLVETDTVSYYLYENGVLGLFSATAQNATGTLNVMLQ